LNLFPQALTTDASGNFQIDGVGAGRVMMGLEVSAPGFGSSEFSVMTVEGAGAVEPGKDTPLAGRAHSAHLRRGVSPWADRVALGARHGPRPRDRPAGGKRAGRGLGAGLPRYVHRRARTLRADRPDGSRPVPSLGLALG